MWVGVRAHGGGGVLKGGRDRGDCVGGDSRCVRSGGVGVSRMKGHGVWGWWHYWWGGGLGVGFLGLYDTDYLSILLDRTIGLHPYIFGGPKVLIRVHVRGV